MGGLVERLLDGLQGLDFHLLLLVTALFMILETSALVGLLVPGDLVVVLAGTTAVTPGRFVPLVIVVIAASLTGASLGHLLGRTAGARLRHGRAGRWLGEANWVRAEGLLGKGHGWAIAASRFVGVVQALLPVVAGSVGVPYRRFIRWVGAGSVVWALAYTTAGVLAGASWRAYGDRLGMAGWVLFGALVVGVPLWRLVRRRQARRAGSRAVAHDGRQQD